MLPWIGKSICSYCSELRQNKVIVIDFQNITEINPTQGGIER